MRNQSFIYGLSFFGGFLSLSQEILWMRIASFIGMTVPQAFSYTLGLFLFGIAFGAVIGKKICQNNTVIQLPLLGTVFLAAAAYDLLAIAILFLFSKFFDPSIWLVGLLVLLCALVRGIAFPIVHHIGTSIKKTGAQISNVYFANVFGSTLAPLLIGFMALNYLTTQQVYLLVCAVTAFIALFCFNSWQLKSGIAAAAAMALFGLLIPEKLFHEFSKNSYGANIYPSQLLENKYGFIQVYDDDKDKVVFGANVYDGKLNTDIFHNSNGIDRAYLLAALKPNAKSALVIGLSTGSWVEVLRQSPSLEKITVIEINPAYVDIIKQHPEVNQLLQDDRIEIVFTDGRKYLKQHSNQHFDIVLMNTTWHWRAYASNLLSQDFLLLIKKVLNKDGMAIYNTTDSLDAYFTANQVFNQVYQYKNMALVANQTLIVDKPYIQQNLCSLKDYNSKKPIFISNQQCKQAANVIFSNPILEYKDIDLTGLGRAPMVITDNNMITEYKFGKGI